MNNYTIPSNHQISHSINQDQSPPSVVVLATAAGGVKLGVVTVHLAHVVTVAVVKNVDVVVITSIDVLPFFFVCVFVETGQEVTVV